MPSSAGKTCALDRKSTRLNSSHTIISYAVLFLKKTTEEVPEDSGDQGGPRAAGQPPAERAAQVAGCWCDGRGSGAAGQQPQGSVVFFFNDTATTEIYTLSLHDALPI